MNVKTDRERKDVVLRFRVNRGERKQLELLSRETGLSFSGLIRREVLGKLTPYKMTAAEKRSKAEADAIANRTDLPDSERERLHGELVVRAIHRTRVAHGKAAKVRERATVRKYKGRRAG